MRLLLRSTVIAIAITLLSLLVSTLFFTRVMRVSVPPKEFASWSAPKEEAWLYKHRHPPIAGVELLKTWLHKPSEAIPYLDRQAEFMFVFCWAASFLGGFWQMRSRQKV